jgi:hypothetical protein
MGESRVSNSGAVRFRQFKRSSDAPECTAGAPYPLSIVVGPVIPGLRPLAAIVHTHASRVHPKRRRTSGGDLDLIGRWSF